MFGLAECVLCCEYLIGDVDECLVVLFDPLVFLTDHAVVHLDLLGVLFNILRILSHVLIPEKALALHQMLSPLHHQSLQFLFQLCELSRGLVELAGQVAAVPGFRVELLPANRELIFGLLDGAVQ